MGRSIVVAFRMSPAGLRPGSEGDYVSRARSLCSRGETLGGRLVAWSAALLALAWDSDSIEEAILLATSIREEALSPERAWSSGIAVGELEPLGPDGEHQYLAWGRPLLAAASLARAARPGEVVVGDDVPAVRSGQLSLLDARVAADGREAVSGWRIDIEHPWKHASELGAGSARARQDANGPLADRIRRLARGDESVVASDALARLRRARARAEGAGPVARCQAALALGMMLTIAGRPEEALLEALDALARAKEAQDPKAIEACTALLAKLYAGAGLPHAATALRDGVGL